MATKKKPAPAPVLDDDGEPIKVVVGEIIPPPNSKMTQEKAELICQLLMEGNYPSTAALAAGISPDTLREWCRRGEREIEGPYYEFSKAVLQAKALGEATLLSRIAAAGHNPNHWQANAWILERTQPDKFGLRNRIEVQVRQQILERAKDEGVDPDELLRAATQLALEAAEGEEDAD